MRHEGLLYCVRAAGHQADSLGMLKPTAVAMSSWQGELSVHLLWQ